MESVILFYTPETELFAYILLCSTALIWKKRTKLGVLLVSHSVTAVIVTKILLTNPDFMKLLMILMAPGMTEHDLE